MDLYKKIVLSMLSGILIVQLLLGYSLIQFKSFLNGEEMQKISTFMFGTKSDTNDKPKKPSVWD